MRKTKLFSLFAAILCAASMWADVAVNGKLPGAFSVSATKVVYFSQGNLQYNSDEQKWQFAAHQYDYIGNTTGNTSITVDGKADNTGIADLFGWVGASSIWDTELKSHGLTSSTATNNTNGYGNVANENLKDDWGSLMGTGWRTLTNAEWGYLFNTRTSGNSVNGVSNARYTEATINTDGTAVNGIILFPDDAVLSSVSGVTWGTINSSSAWGTKCTSAGWTALETAGCVFLPAAGYRDGTSVDGVGSYGVYWSSSANSATNAYDLFFRSGNVNPQYYNNRYRGYSVRLVSETAPTPSEVNLTANQDPLNTLDYYSTFFSSSTKYTLPAGAQAYVATLNGDALNLTKIAEAGQVLPADNAVILKANSSSITLTPSTAAAVTFTAPNNLQGVDEPTASPANCYVLSGHSSDYSVTGVGFYQYNGTLKAHKAYAVIGGGGSMAPKRLRFVFSNENTATGMENVQRDNVQSTKVLRNGQLIIIRGDKEYNAQGQIVK